MLQAKQILLLEDDDAIRDSLRQLLELEGYAVYPAENGKTGLQQLRRMSHPALILMDLFMPEMSGNEFLATLIKEDPSLLNRIPLLVVTAAPLEGDVARSVKPFIRAAIQKPIDAEALLQQIRKLVV